MQVYRIVQNIDGLASFKSVIKKILTGSHRQPVSVIQLEKIGQIGQISQYFLPSKFVLYSILKAN